MFIQGHYIDDIGEDIYVRSEDDDKIGSSIEDRQFMELMSREMKRGESGNLYASLPFKPEKKRLPNNRERVFTRFQSLLRSFQKKPELKQHYLTFMQTVLEKGHAELAPEPQTFYYLTSSTSWSSG